MNAAKASFPTSIVGIVFTCFGWVGQGSPKQEGFKAYKYGLYDKSAPNFGDLISFPQSILYLI